MKARCGRSVANATTELVGGKYLHGVHASDKVCAFI